MTRTPDADRTRVRGAVYVPARAYNAYQSWRDYSPSDAERDLDFAAGVNLNALRVFLSYEYWQADPAGLEDGVDHLLGAASERDIGIVPILFESAGEEPTTENLTDRGPTTACAVRSPSHAVIKNERSWRNPTDAVRGVVNELRGERRDRWAEPRAFVEWVVDRYGDDSRLSAIEVMNEPGGWSRRVDFARAMLRTAADRRGAVPLTMGCKSLDLNHRYADPELDVYQFHYNLPPTPEDMASKLAEAADLAARTDTPVWLTEWQRTREEPPDVLLPNYASLAPTIRSSDVDGDFLWSLMVKPAYLPKPREWGRINGVFHEDGSVWSADDARAIAGDESLEFEERRAVPPWIPEEVTPDA